MEVKVDRNAIGRLAERLNSEDLFVRNRTMKKLRRLIERSAAVDDDDVLNETNLVRLWKGLHYCLLVAEDVQLQEELSDHFVGLGLCLGSPEKSLRFAYAFLKVENSEWPLLDHQKISRFVTLSRKVLIKVLQLQQDHVSAELAVEFLNALEKLFTNDEINESGFINTIVTIVSEESKTLPEVTGNQCRKFLECLQTKCRFSDAENPSQSHLPAEIAQSCNADGTSTVISSSTKRKHGHDIDDNHDKNIKKPKLEDKTATKSNKDDSMNKESEIKNCNGPMEQVAAKHFSMEEKHCRTISPKRPQTKSLFATPKSDPTNMKKRVSFALNHNKSQNYEDSLNLTPRFDPNQRPVKGVLKQSPGFSEFQEKSNLFKRKKILKRLKATRFV